MLPIRSALSVLCCTLLALAAVAYSAPAPGLLDRNSRRTDSDATLVDLGYARYQGVYDEQTQLRSWYGIRYVAPATQASRWQAPQPPVVVNYTVPAHVPPPSCLQQPSSGQGKAQNKDASEDCLFINVVSPANASALPVLVWFHGGGYGAGAANVYDPAPWIEGSATKFVFVAVQYRLGILGFLSSGDLIQNGGVANAGLLDQNASLEWVQSHIAAFGGDPTRVTIAGQSAGGGSVLHHSISYNGSLGTALFKGIIASSPSSGVVRTELFNSSATEQLYANVTEAAQCPTTGSAFACLTSLTFAQISNVSQQITDQSPHGTWAFNPVIDGSFLVDQPAKLLAQGRVNGQYALVGHNAEEGTAFVPAVTNDTDSAAWLSQVMPFLNGNSTIDTNDVLKQYPYDITVQENFATSGSSGPTVSSTTSTTFGEHARLANIWAEANIICPATWLGSAFGPRGFLYQYSVIPALHTSDLSLIFPSIAQQNYHGPELKAAFQAFWADFITRDDPRLQACHKSQQMTVDTTEASNKAMCNWPTSTENVTDNIQVNETQRLNFLNLNQTGGHLATHKFHAPLQTKYFASPGLLIDFTVADSYFWEGGRGARCDWWRNLLTSQP